MDSTKSEALFKKFIEMEKDAGDIIPSFRSNDKVNLWPVMKLAYFSDFYLGHARTYLQNNLSLHVGITQTTRNIDRKTLELLASAPKKLGLVFTCKDTHTRTIDGKKYDPYLDPIIQEMSSLGLVPVKLQFHEGDIGEYHIPPAEIALDISNSFLPLDRLPAITGYQEYVQLCIDKDVPPLHQVRIHQEYAEVRSYCEAFQAIFAALQPSFVILENYYNRRAMGLSLACRRLGIPCVEYQHGMQCRHIMYVFAHVPKDGFEVVPKWFFTWGEDPAENLRAMFAGQSFHRVAVAGKPEYLAWARGFIRDDPAMVRALRRRIAGKKAILVPLRLNVTEPERLALRQAMETSPPDWIWLVRQHPLIPSKELDFARDAANVESQLTTRLLLDTVLSLSDHLVSGASTVCLEARFLHGLPVTLLGELAAYFYESFVRTDRMQTASTPEDILRRIHAGRRAPADEPLPDAYITKDTALLAPLLHLLARGV